MPCKNHPFVEDNLTRCSRCAEAFCPDCIVEIGGQPYCLNCKTESMRDLRSGVPVHDLDVASIGRRFAALLLDGLVLAVPLFILAFLVAIPMGLLGSEENMPLALFSQLVLSMMLGTVYILYEGLMLASGGQTVGKKAMDLKVVTAEGNDIAKGQAWTRAVSRQLLGLVPCLGLIDYLVAFGQEKTCIHDMLAKTRVINWHG